MSDSGIFQGIPHADYHADAGGPRLSRSLAHKLLSRSPRHAWAAHPLLGNCGPDEDTKEKSRGSLLHLLLLGVGAMVQVVDADSFRTAAAKESREEAEAIGRLPVLRKHFDLAEATAAEMRTSLAEAGFNLLDYERETTAFWEQDGVRCRARLDLLRYDHARIADLKIQRSAAPDTFAGAMLRYGLDIQHAAYVSAVEHSHPGLAGRVKMEFLLLEPYRPYAVTRARPAGSMRALGASKWRRALGIWRDCLASGIWPSYPSALIEAPTWALSNDFGTEVAAAGDPDWLDDDSDDVEDGREP